MQLPVLYLFAFTNSIFAECLIQYYSCQSLAFMATARSMADIYETNRQVCKYVHSTSRGHEAIQIAQDSNYCPAIM